MDAKELRLGNLLALKDDWFKGEYAKITCIQSHCVLIKYFVGTPDIKDIHPIPLTTEILEKCGFEKDEKYYTEKTFDFTIKSMDKDETNFMLVIGISRVGCFIKYVHQLQNIFYDITGTELSIKL